MSSEDESVIVAIPSESSMRWRPPSLPPQRNPECSFRSLLAYFCAPSTIITLNEIHD